MALKDYRGEGAEGCHGIKCLVLLYTCTVPYIIGMYYYIP